MRTILKTALAICLGLGFLALDAHSKTVVAFLGLSRESDPRYGESMAKRIRWELGADTSLLSFSDEEIGLLYSKGVLREPQVGPTDMARLSQGLGAQYYAFGRLEPMAMESKRAKWKFWDIKVKWTQGMRLRVLDGSDGKVVYDSLISAEIPEAALFSAPESDFGRMAPLKREGLLRNMSVRVSVQTAKALASGLALATERKKKAAGAAVNAESKP
jgi:hypothetical protein